MDDHPFVGRDEQLAMLEKAFRSSSAGAPHVAFVVGGAGLGKTTLVSRFVNEHRDAAVIRADGTEDEQDIPYALLAQLRARAPGDGPTSDPTSFAEAGAELLRVFGDLQGSGSLIVWVDDVQWADAPSVRALVFAFRRLGSDRVLLIVSLRDEYEPLLPDGLRRLEQRPEATRVVVDSLSLPDLEVLCSTVSEGRLTRPAARRLHIHTAGSPLHARALLLELSIDDLNDVDRELPAPRSFAVLIIGRLATCSADARALVTAASILGMRCDLTVAARLAGIDDPMSAYDEAVRTGFFDGADDRTLSGIAFAHPLVRAAVYDALSPRERSEVHRRAAALGGSDVLRHRIAVAQAAGGDDVLHDDLVESAMNHAAHGEWEVGSRYLFAASTLASEPEDRIARELEAIDFVVLAGDGARAMAYLERSSAPASKFRFYVEGGARLLTGDLESAEALLRKAWDLHDQSDPGERLGSGGSASRLSRLLMSRLRAEETLAWIGIARSVDFNPPWGSRLGTYELHSLGIAGRFREAFDVIGNGPASGDYDGLAGRGIIRLWTGDNDGAIADLSLVDATMQNPTNPHRLLNLGQLAESEYRAGRWDAAAGHADLAASLVDDTDQFWIAGFAHGIASLVPSARGQWDVAEEHVRTARLVSANVGPGLSSVWADVAAVHLASARNDPALCVAAADGLARARGVDGVSEPGVFQWRHMYIEALVATGGLQEARTELDAFEAVAHERACLSARLSAGLARGLLEAAGGDDARARIAFEGAAALSSEGATPFDRARLELAYGAFLRRTGERRRAATLLSQALTTFQGLRATPFEERCERERRACGLAPSSRTTVDVTKLTPQELSVARLVGEGRTNREVAADLVVSVKTIETHLGHVYAKLGVRSRTELAAKLAAEPPTST